MLALAAALAGGASAVEIHVAGAEERHRVSVLGLAPEVLERLRAEDAARLAQLLSVFVGEPASGKPAILGAVEADAGCLHFAPRFPFVAGVGYTARLDLNGVRRDFGFTVDAPGGQGPRVLGIFPSADTLPENTLRLYVHFSQPMEARAAQSHVHLLDERGDEVPLAFVEIEHGLWDPEQTRLTLLFHPGRVKRGVAPGERLGPPLVGGRRYRIRVDAAMTDAAGRPLDASFEKAFTATAADRASPRADAIGVRAPDVRSGRLVVDLPEPLDAGLLRRLIWVEDAHGGRVAGALDVDAGETRWSFQAAGGWMPGAYAVRVHPALEDRAGNRFDRLFDRDAAPESDAPVAPIAVPFRVGRTHRPF